MDNFESWCERLLKVAVEEFGMSKEAAATLDLEAFRAYFDAGTSPRDALREDFSYGE